MCHVGPVPPPDVVFGFYQRRRDTSSRQYDVSRCLVGVKPRSNLGDRLSGEINLKSIRALEEQIKEHEMAIVNLKRARNSLLNVSRFPPEILGDIFRRNTAVEEYFGGLEKRSHNFLLVCHHWFKVALQTPEVWSSWGNNLQDWKKWHLRYPMAPLDLVLDEESSKGDTLDDSIRTALQDRAARDTIRQIHLLSHNLGLLRSIISSLAGSEEIRSSSLESVVIAEGGGASVDVSDLFTYYRFPKLQCLRLGGCTVSSWDLVASRTSALTTLSLSFSRPTPTASQLLSILGSNPLLQVASLVGCEVSDDDGGKTSFQVPLYHLRALELAGDPRSVIELLNRLDHPGHLDRLEITLFRCTSEDISETIGPCLRDYLRQRGKSRGGLGLDLSTGKPHIRWGICDVSGIDFSAPGSIRMEKFMEIIIWLDSVPPMDVMREMTLNLIAHAPREEVVYFQTFHNPVAMEEVSAQFPHLRALHLWKTPLRVVFPKPTPGMDREMFPSLQHLTLDHVSARRGNWSPLTAFLARRVSSGNQLDTLEMSCSSPLHPDTEEGIRRAVREFRVTNVGEV